MATSTVRQLLSCIYELDQSQHKTNRRRTKMIISDLSYATVVDANVIGGTKKKPAPKKYYPPVAIALAGAESLALGKYTATATYTSTTAVAGVGSSSSSASAALAIG
jgi:hypothetical protein